jgi:hypothetical protein
VEDIKNEMKKSALTGFLLGCFIMPIVIANADDAPNLDDINEETMKQMDSSPFIKMYSGPLFCSRFREILEEADDVGVFESKAWQKFKKIAEVADI